MIDERLETFSDCTDCDIDLCRIKECVVFEPKIEVWESISKKGESPFWNMLCVGCFEKRLGRTLTAADFDEGVEVDYTGEWMSKRLVSRMTA